jgi:hypothetical protein
MHNTPTKKRKEKEKSSSSPSQQRLMGTDNPSSPFAAACTINVKRTPISENSPSLQLQFQKHRQPNKNPCIWCNFHFLESYIKTPPPPPPTNNLNNLE